NFFNLAPSDQHMPLVIMLVFTQLSVGAFAVDTLMNLDSASQLSITLGRSQSLVALALGLLALGASVFHLGRPLYAFRAFIGLRKSWMSREIVAFGLFVSLAMVYALSYWATPAYQSLQLDAVLGLKAQELHRWLSYATTATGALALTCSIMIYKTTQRLWWDGPTTSIKFLGTAAVLGVATMALTVSLTGLIFPEHELKESLHHLLRILIVLSVGKLIYEASIFLHLFDKQQGDLKRTALLMRRDLAKETSFRFALGAFGGLLVPSLLIASDVSTSFKAPTIFVGLVMLALIGGEILERVLFFRAVSAPRMPGAVGQ
ncbi:MAG: dimethyl sulfoxide reductase anchor subunit, partial [Polyangiaceae bacterium]|nr:dimethyl sulfoxide reductase anchor subunit [Polyangiaceae bacterium]